MPMFRLRRRCGRKRPLPSKIPRRWRCESFPRNPPLRGRLDAALAGLTHRTASRKRRIAGVPEGEVLRIVGYAQIAPWVGRPRGGYAAIAPLLISYARMQSTIKF